MKLSKREMNLFYILFTIGIVVGFLVIVIFPLQNSITLQKTLNASLTEQKNLIDVQIANGAGLDTKLNTVLSNVNDELTKIESPITSEEFELRLQPYLTINDIKILSWVVNEPAVSSPTLPFFQKSNLIYKLQELLDNYSQVAPTVGKIPVTTSELVKTTIIISFISPYSVYTGLLDMIANMNSTIYVSASNRENTTGTTVIFVDIYSISKLSNTHP